MAARSRKSAGSAADRESLSFEVALEQLEGIVDRLEQGDLELEEAMTAFERGVALSKQCAAKLDALQQRIEVLTREGGEWMTRPLDPEDGDAEDEVADEVEAVD